MAASTSTAANLKNDCDVFINYRCPDVKKTFASLLYHRLSSHGLRLFLDLPEQLHHGEDLGSQIEGTIRSAFIHVAIFSPNYAQSNWCLNELVLMLESGAPIIPVFYNVKPYELRPGDTAYVKALLRHAERKIYDPKTAEMKPRYDSETIENWENALSRMADKSGFELEACNGDEGKLLDLVVQCVLNKFKKPPLNVFINHRGPDVKKTFASYLYHRLLFHEMQPFLDEEELKGGDNLTSTIEAAIRSASVHVAIFSPRYAESIWCLKELVLMLESGAPIIPVFYHVKPSELRWTRVNKKRGRTRVKNGAFAQALHKLESKQRCDSRTIETWRDVLSRVGDTSGFELEKYNSEGALLEAVVERLLEMGKEKRGTDQRLRV